MDSNDSLICHITNIYAPARRSERSSFFAMINNIHHFHHMSSLDDPWFYLETAEGTIVTSPKDLLKEARAYYSNLYSPEEAHSPSIDSLLGSIPDECTLSSEDQDMIVEPLALEDLFLMLKHAPVGKSSDLDGIGFEV
ncbi:hypothetical protein BDB01DRAFT_904559 [Pilobolus umbonatus]|nr:hypothetical protein BDB01DRAFT_904559 [Pilobolus umbonatus]